jgi:hypothetical protein
MGFTMNRLAVWSLLGFLTGCAQRIVIAEYPVKQPQSGDSHECGASPTAAKPAAPLSVEFPHYWSAYAFIDPHNIALHWDKNSLSQIFVSAEVRIPTDSEPIVSDFPLFTAHEGSIQQHAGVDILNKLPIMTNAREQVSITIKVRYLKNREALETARKILSVAEGIAKPFLDNYPVASQVLSAATGTIDQVVEGKKEQLPNSLAKYIVPDFLEAARLSDGRWHHTVAFMLLSKDDISDTDEEAPKPAPGEGAKTGENVEATKNPQAFVNGRYSRGLTTCTDMPFALCELQSYSSVARGGECYQEAPVKVPYVTLTLRGYDEVYDPMLLLPGGFGSCSMLSEAGVDRVRKYLDANRVLFHPEDIARVESNLVAAERQLQAQALAVSGDVIAMIEFLNEHGRPDYEPAFGEGACVASFEEEAANDEKPRTESKRCSAIVDDAWNLWACEQAVWGRVPGRDVLRLWKQAHGLDDRCSKGKSDAACQVGHLGRMMSSVFQSLGTSVELGKPHDASEYEALRKDILDRAPTLMHWYWQLRSSQANLLEQIKAIDENGLCQQPLDVARQFVAPYCDECTTKLQALAKTCPINVARDWAIAAQDELSEFARYYDAAEDESRQ